MRLSPLIFAAALVACAPNQPITAHTTLSSGADLAQGKLIPVASFSQQDIVALRIDLTWPDSTQDLGYHRLHFTWSHNGQVIFTHVLRPLLVSSPWTVTARHPAITLGTGPCHVIVTLDDTPIIDQSFVITSQ